MEGLWSLITIVGPILLAAVLIYALVTNRRRTRAQVERTEEATRRQYEAPDGPDSGQRH
ncbi:hypothetical protein [Sphingomonas profundi]|uniref:hypothetical protein n=1 Tax=Alterirhizorhabdus profundi TaxID=2681549 RepID=UPI0012E6F6A4|nr:hypothetical protein [Sphingomonas profundi]